MRIECYTKRSLAESFYFLREAQAGPDHYKEHEMVHIVAEEIDDDGKFGRWWFVVNHGQHGLANDGYFAPWFPPHVVVDAQSIRAGEPSQPFTNWVKRDVSPPGQEELTRLRKQRLDRIAAEVRHTLHCRQVVDDRATLVEQAARIANLESELSAADTRNREFAERVTTLASELEQARAELAALRASKSVTHRVRKWARWSTKTD